MQDATRKRVLVVEDEEDVMTYLSTLFKDIGFEVETARQGGEAMEAVEDNKPDLITLDIVMPEKTGVRFYNSLKSIPRYADVPVIIVTGLQKDFESFIRQQKNTPPPEGYISKPFDKETLTAEIERVLGIELKKAEAV